MVPVGASTLAWELRTPCCSPSSTALSQDSWAAESSSGGTSSSSILATSLWCMRSTLSIGSAFVVEAGEGPHAGRGAGRGGVGVARHERRDGTRPRTAPVRVVGQALGHQQRTEVGVAETELAEAARVLGDLLGRIVGVADEDLLGREHHLDGGLEPVDVERPVLVAGT